MVNVTETTREGIEKVLLNLGWILDFWNEKMHNISVEGKMDRSDFLKAKDIGIKFMETFIIPTAESYEWKLKEFKIEETINSTTVDDEEGPKVKEDLLADGFLNGIPGKRIGRPPGSKNKEKLDRVPVPPSLVPDAVPDIKPVIMDIVLPVDTVPTVTVVTPEGSTTHFYRKPHTKYRKSYKESSLTLAQRDQITDRWVDNKGVMTDLKCSDLAREMGFGGPNQVQGWVSYLTKVVNNSPDLAGRTKGWRWMIDSGKISPKPIPVFFTDKVEVAFTSKPKAVV